MSSAIFVIDPSQGGLSDEPPTPAASAWSDWLGVVASVGCAIHCAAMPFVIAYLPALGLSFLADEAFHKWMAAGCFVIALVAFVPGLRKHGRWAPVTIAVAGLAMITVAAFGFAGECCPSCDATASGDGTIATAHDSTAPACTDAGCTVCATDDSAAPSADSSSSLAILDTASGATSPWLSAIAPWLTPLGGIVLVSAHLLNRRFGCLCGCCEVKPAKETAG